MLDALRLDLSQAYTAISEADRAWLKQSMVMAQYCYGFLPWQEEQRREQAECAGFSSVLGSQPVHWALLFFPPQYPAPVRLLAALMPALLARVPVLVPVCTGSACAQNLLAALELAGVENVYALERAGHDAEALMQYLSANAEQKTYDCGVVLTLAGATVPASCADWIAARKTVRCWKEDVPLRCAFNPHNPALDREQIRRSHPDMELCALPLDAEDGVFGFDALYGASAPAQVPLVLGAGLEGCWIYPQLVPDFFRVRRMAFDYRS